MCCSKKRNSAPAIRESSATALPPTQTAARASTINQYQAFNAGEYEMAKHPSAPPLYSSIHSDRPTSTTLIDNALYDEHKPHQWCHRMLLRLTMLSVYIKSLFAGQFYQGWIRTGTARNGVPVKILATGTAFRLRFEFFKDFRLLVRQV